MRVSTALIHDTAVGSIQDQQTKLLSLQQQVATGRRAVKPSDDPIATARALEVSQSKSVNNQFQLNQGYAKEALGLVENKLEGVKDILGYVRDQVVAAGNGSFSQSERDAVAIDLRARFDALLSLANSQDGKGEYVFSGFKGDTQPFAGGLSGVTYQGDQGERTMQVSTSRVLPVSNSGDEVFMKVPGSTANLFGVISNFITDLENPLASVPAAVSTALTELDSSFDNILRVQASIGSRVNEVEALENVSGDLDLQYAQAISRLQDVDYAEAISDLTMEQTFLQAAQQSFLRVANLSLFNFLN
ncbi:MAG: flagellar hook-associated protein FlgL [Rhodocyclaceae bacterium]|nr:flagellar hook-associated protein FlgL [Rhodocyclaceae bacterium]